MKKNLPVLNKLFILIGNYKLLLVLSIILSAVMTGSQLYIPVLFGKTIDLALGEGRVDILAIREQLFTITLFIIIASLASLLMNMINNAITFGVVRDLRNKAMEHIQKLPLSYLDSHSIGDILQRVIGDAEQLCDGLLLGFNQLFAGVLTIFLTLYFMFSKNVFITLLVMVMTPLSFVVAGFISSRSYSLFSRQNSSRGQLGSLINEIVSNQKLVKDFAYEEKASERFRKINEELKKDSVQAIFYSSLVNPSTRAVNSLIYALVALTGAFRILSGILSIGDLSALLTYANQYMKPFNDISSVVSELQNSFACAARVFELIEAEPESRDNDRELAFEKGIVKIEDVCFSYDKDKKLIEDFDFEGKKSMRIAIVGPTGSGKTTLINLLMRFYDVDKGRILIDGQDISKISRSSLRKTFGMVLQDTWLKNASVRDNIAYGVKADDERIIEVAKKCHCYEFIRRLPEGLDTIIDDESLSAGQKQLLCIARVMIADPDMLILDEATSNIDTRTEVHVQNAFDELMKGRTSFIVAHRLSTIRDADWILVMKEGKIVEQGDHKSLLRKKGFYYDLYNAQFAKL